MKLLIAILFILLASGCAIKPPVQEMAEARAAIAAARELPDRGESSKILKSAEASMQDAAKAMESNKYDRARMSAKEAKRKARQAAKIKQNE